MKRRRKIPIGVWVALGAAVLIGAATLVWYFYPIVSRLSAPENMELFRENLQSFGILGTLVLFCIQVLQVLSGIIPSLPIQISAGLAYGALGGLLICWCGVAAGSTIVFLAVKRFGQPLVDKVFTKERQEKLSFLNNAPKLNMIVFILYLIPALPKDVFTYLAALTPITFGRFISISMTARIPMILCSTFASGALMEGNYTSAIIMFCVSGALGLAGMLLAPKIMERLQKLRRKK